MDSPYQQIETLYKMMFPFNEFNGDYLRACINIRREIKNWCKLEFKIPLLMITSVLDMKPKPNIETKLSELCKTVRINIENICLNLENQEGAQTLIHIKTGTIVPESVSTICEKIYNLLIYDSYDEEYLLYKLYTISGIFRPIRFRKDNDEDFINYFVTHDEDFNEKNISRFINLISPLKVDIDIFNRIENIHNVKLTIQDIEFLQYLHHLIIKRKIPFDIRLKDLCNNYEVLKFRSSVAL